jgi:nucleoside-diphosphate-sugar epimerase
MKVLVTGSNGFIGSNFVTAAHKMWDVTCMVKNNIDRLPIGVPIVRHDLSEPFYTEEKYDVVVHVAACPSAKECIDNPQLGMDNIKQTFNILELCRRNSIPKLVFFSTCEVYGAEPDSVETDILKSFNMYGASKVAGEHMCSAYSHSYGIKTILLRILNVWGPGTQEERFAYKIEKAFREQEKPHFVLHSHATKRWIHVDDVTAKTIELILKEDLPVCDAVNIVGAESITLENFIKNFGSNFTIEYKNDRSGGYQIESNARGEKFNAYFQ